MTARLSGERGITLIELIVALVLLGLIATALSGGLRFGARVWETGAKIGRDIERIQLAQDFLRRQIELADLRPRAGRARRRRDRIVQISGEGDQFRFTSLLPVHLGTPGYYMFDIFLSDGALQLKWSLIDGRDEAPQSGDEQATSRTTILIDRVVGIAFDYASGPQGGDAPEWQPDWSSKLGVPGLVRLKVDFARHDRRYWPELVIAPKLIGGRRRRGARGR